MADETDWVESVTRALNGAPSELREGLNADIEGAWAALERVLPPDDEPARTLDGAYVRQYALIHEDLRIEQVWAKKLFLSRLRRGARWARLAYHLWYQPVVDRICRQRVRDAQEARDLAMDISLLFIERYAERATTTFPGYLIRMARTLSLRATQRAPPEISVALVPELRAPCEGPDERATRRELLRMLRRCLEQLPPGDQELLAARFERELTLQQLAEARGVTVQAVHQKIRRLLNKILTCMKGGAAPLGEPR